MSRRTWLFAGVGFGFTIPILLNGIQMLGHWPIRPSYQFLFRPGLVLVGPVAGFCGRTHSGIFDLLFFVVNAVVIGVAAYGLRKGFVVLIAVLVVVSYVRVSLTGVLRRDAVGDVLMLRCPNQCVRWALPPNF